MKKIIEFFCHITFILLLTSSIAFTVYASQISDNNDKPQSEIDFQFIRDSDCIILDDDSVQLTRTAKIKEYAGTSNYLSDAVLITSTDPQKRAEIANEIRNIRQSRTVLRSSGGDHGEYVWDSSGSVKLSTRVYFTTTTTNKLSYTKITKVKGSYSNENGVSVKTHKLRIGQCGKSIVSGKYVEQIKNYTLSSKSWSKTPSSTWKAVCIDTSPVTIGCTYTATLKRGTSNSTWNVELVNNLSVNSLK